MSINIAVKSRDHTRCDVPSRGEGQQVGQRRGQVARLGCKNTENGWVNVVNGDGAHVDKFGEVIFIGDLSQG
jgi:hypothetical protein